MLSRGSFEVAVLSSTIGITRVRAAFFINYIHLANTVIYSVLMMLDQNLSSKRVSIFNASLTTLRARSCARGVCASV